MSDTLGFPTRGDRVKSAEPGKVDLTGFDKPTPGPALEIPDYLADSAAKRAGFTSSEAQERFIMPPPNKSTEPRGELFIRAPISLVNRYKQYCTANQITTGDLLEQLMRNLPA